MSRRPGFKIAEATKQKLRERFQHHPSDFWERCTTAQNGCLIRSGHRNSFGYVLCGYQGKLWSSHRLSWTLANGPIPEGMNVLHHCDNPSCCNPSHLFIGTLSDNIQDCIAKGRYHKHVGDSHPGAKLRVNIVDQIRSEFVPYVVTVRMLAEKFKVTDRCIKAALSGQNWEHVGTAKKNSRKPFERAAIDESMVRKIWEEFKRGLPQNKIASAMGISSSAVCAILKGHNWNRIYMEMTKC